MPTDYLQMIGRTPLLTRADEIRLFTKIANGCEQSRDHVIRANLRLVINLTKKLNKGVWDADKNGEGVLGLIYATEKFNLDFELKFSTYATWWIRQSIQKFNGGDHSRRRETCSLRSKWRTVEEQLTHHLGCRPSNHEINQVLGYTQKQIDVVQATMLSMSDFEIGDDYIDEIQLEKEVFDVLTPKEANVIRMLFGVSPYIQMNLREIAEQYGESHEWIRKTKERALGKLASRVDS